MANINGKIAFRKHLDLQIIRRFGTTQCNSEKLENRPVPHSTTSQTKYKYVRLLNTDNGFKYCVRIPIFNFYKTFDDIRQAAIEVDKQFLQRGFEAKNILKRK